MTDREPTIPADPPPQPNENAANRVLIPQAGRAKTAIAGGSPPTTNAPPESALRGDGLPMSLTLAPRPHVRAPATDELPADPVRAWLARLSTPGAELASFTPTPCCCPPSELTLAETEAASRAIACPDLFIIHAPDFTVRERVISAIARLSSAETGRCLVLCPNPIAADRLTERLAKSDDTCVVRALAEDENPVRPTPLVAKVTSAAIGTTRADRLKRDAAAVVAAADARLMGLEKLTELARRVTQLDAEIAEHLSRREAIEVAVRGEVNTPFADRLAAQKNAHEQLVARLTSEIEVLSHSSKEKEAALVAVRQQHADATAETAKKPGFIARLFGGGKSCPDPAELEKHIQTLQADIAAIVTNSDGLKAKLTEAATTGTAEREQAIQQEVAARRVEVDSHVAALTAEQGRIRAEAEALGTTLAVVDQSCDELTRTQYSATLALVQAKELAAEVNQTAAETTRRFLTKIPVVVGTPGSLYVDPVFGRDPANDGGAPFALLVLDQAEELGEQEFIQLAKLASRWVLIGDTAPTEEPKPHLNGTGPRHGPARNGRPIEVPFTTRLARLLDRETWAVEGDRLVCRLIHTTPDQRRDFTREPLLDRPEIELRFLVDAAGELALAEVAFPGSAGMATAKSFLFHQLGEVLLRPFGALLWEQTPSCVSACWPEADRATTDATWIDLEPGVRERVVGVGVTAFTSAVSFDLTADWNAERAEAWLNERLRTESAGRFAVVPRTTRV